MSARKIILAAVLLSAAHLAAGAQAASAVTDLVFSPDGTELATAYRDMTVRVTDAATGAEKRILREWLTAGGTGKLYALAMHPSGELIACGGLFEGVGKARNGRSIIQIIDFRTGAVVRILGGELSCVGALRFSPDGSFLAAGDSYGSSKFWRTGDWKEYRTMSPDHEDSVHALAFSPDGSRLASASFDGSILVKAVPLGVDPASAAGIIGRAPVARREAAHSGGVRRIAWSPDGRLIATGGMDGTIKLWSAPDLSPLGVLKEADSADLSYVAFVDSGTILCGGSYHEKAADTESYPLYLIDVATKAARPLGAHAGTIQALAVSPDGRTVASAGNGDGEAALRDARSLATLRAPVLAGKASARMAPARLAPPDGRPVLRIDTEGHSAAVNAVAFGHGGEDLITASSDKTIRIRDAATGREKRVIRGWLGDGELGAVSLLSVDPSGRWLACAGIFDDGEAGYGPAEIRVIEYDTGRVAAVLVASPKTAFRSIRFSPDGRTLAAGEGDGALKFWSADNWGAEPRIPVRQGDSIALIAFSPDGSRLACAGSRSSLRLLSASDGKLLRTVGMAHFGDLRGLAYSPDGKTIASTGSDGEVKLWSAEDLRYIRTVAGGEKADFYLKDHLAFLDERILVYSESGSKITKDERPIHILDLETGTERTFAGHTDAVRGLAVAPDGRRVASAGGVNHEVLLWDARSLTLLKTFRGRGNSVWAVSYDSERGRIAFGTQFRGGYPHSPSDFDKCFDIAKGTVTGPTGNGYVSDDPTWLFTPAINGPWKTIAERVQVENHKLMQLKRDENKRASTYVPGGKYRIWATDKGLYRVSTDNMNIDGAFVGHEGEIWTLGLSADGKTLITGSEDQTIRFWNVEAFPDRPVFKDPSLFEPFLRTYIRSSYREIDPHRVEDLEELYAKLLGADNYNAQQLVYIPETAPILSLFVGEDSEWIAWTPEGYYYCSLDGAKYAGWHFNRGADESAEFYSLEQYASVFYRPDVIEKALRRVRMDLPGVDFSSRPPAITEFRVNGKSVNDEGETVITTDKSDFTLEFASAGTAALRQPELFYNGRVVNAGKFKGPPQVKLAADRRSLTASYSFSVTGKENRYKLYTVDERGFKSAARTVRVVYTGTDATPAFYKLGEKVPQPKRSGTLYVLSVGINQYVNPAMAAAGMGDLSFAEKDAADMAALWSSQEGRLFDSVETRVLTRAALGRDVTQQDVLDALTALGKKATRETDSVLVFLSGHGLRKDDGFFYLTSEADPSSKEALARTSPSWLTIGDRLKGMTRAKEIVVLVDACHSGAINPTELGFTWKDKGVILITSSKAGQRSYEGGSYVDERKESRSFNNGLFTAAIVEGFAPNEETASTPDARADASRDKVLIVGEVLSYAADRVGTWTQGQQTPWVPAYDPAIEGKVMALTR